jgi:hypothetical protein
MAAKHWMQLALEVRAALAEVQNHIQAREEGGTADDAAALSDLASRLQDLVDAANDAASNCTLP